MPTNRPRPIGDLLGPDRESLYLEYKFTLRWDIKQQHKSEINETERSHFDLVGNWFNRPFRQSL